MMKESKPLDHIWHCGEQGPVFLHEHVWQNVNVKRVEILCNLAVILAKI